MLPRDVAFMNLCRSLLVRLLSRERVNDLSSSTRKQI